MYIKKSKEWVAWGWILFELFVAGCELEMIIFDDCFIPAVCLEDHNIVAGELMIRESPTPHFTC